MKRHGYKGASELAATVDYLFGYDATARVVSDHQYALVTDAYVNRRRYTRIHAAAQPARTAFDRGASDRSDAARACGRTPATIERKSNDICSMPNSNSKE